MTDWAMHEELEHEYWAKYDDVRERYHEEMKPDYDPADDPEDDYYAVKGCAVTERYEAAGAICKAFRVFKKVLDDEIPF